MQCGKLWVGSSRRRGGVRADAMECMLRFPIFVKEDVGRAHVWGE